jgi:hypothetical protein
MGWVSYYLNEKGKIYIDIPYPDRVQRWDVFNGDKIQSIDAMVGLYVAGADRRDILEECYQTGLNFTPEVVKWCSHRNLEFFSFELSSVGDRSYKVSSEYSTPSIYFSPSPMEAVLDFYDNL